MVRQDLICYQRPCSWVHQVSKFIADHPINGAGLKSSIVDLGQYCFYYITILATQLFSIFHNMLRNISSTHFIFTCQRMNAVDDVLRTEVVNIERMIAEPKITQQLGRFLVVAETDDWSCKKQGEYRPVKTRCYDDIGFARVLEILLDGRGFQES